MPPELPSPQPAPVPLRPLGPDPFQPGADASQGCGHLPRPITSLIGRDADVEAARALLIDAGARLVTLSGPGGVGKTRLALRIGEEVAPSFANGVVFVPLAPIVHTRHVLPAIARALGVRESGHQPLAELVTAHLQPRSLLLILDNFEHLLGAAPFLGNLLASCPRLSVLVTSRSVLHLSGEHHVSVPPLATPALGAGAEGKPLPLAELERAEAVQLFVARARAARSDFILTSENAEDVAEICRRLEGVPLAIELAAARLRVLSPSALLARLQNRLGVLTGGPRDVADRHRTMRNAIAWSYDLLTADEQAAFRHLSVFAGGFSLEAAEHVAGSTSSPHTRSDSPSPPTVFDLISSLVDHSLLGRVELPDGEPRFTMLETMREYGLEQLAGRGEELTARRRHAEYYAALAEAGREVFWSSVPGAKQAVWLARLEREHDSLRAALTWALHHDAETALRLAADLSHFWWQRGYLSEGLEWITRALGHSEADSSQVRARALYAASLLTGEQGDYDRSAELAEEALALFRALGDLDGVRRGIQSLGIAALQTGHFDRAAALFAELLASARELGHIRGISTALAHLGGVAIKQGDCARARLFLTEAIALGRQYDDRFGLAWFLYKLGELERAQGNISASITHVQESLLLYRELGSTGRASVCLRTLASLAETTGQPDQLVRLLGAAEAHGQAESGRVLDEDPADQVRLRDRLSVLLDKEIFATAWAAGRALSLDDAVSDALTLAASPDLGHASTSAMATSPPTAAELTSREREVLRLLIAGFSDKEIGASLGIGRRTVSHHVATIRLKLDAPSRTAAATIAVRAGLI